MKVCRIQVLSSVLHKNEPLDRLVFLCFAENFLRQSPDKGQTADVIDHVDYLRRIFELVASVHNRDDVCASGRYVVEMEIAERVRVRLVMQIGYRVCDGDECATDAGIALVRNASGNRHASGGGCEFARRPIGENAYLAEEDRVRHCIHTEPARSRTRLYVLERTLFRTVYPQSAIVRCSGPSQISGIGVGPRPKSRPGPIGCGRRIASDPYAGSRVRARRRLFHSDRAGHDRSAG